MHKEAIYIIIKLYMCVGMFSNVYGKTGIGTDRLHESAILKLNASDKGFKVPEVTLINRLDIITIPSPATGLLVYKTPNSGTNSNEVYAGRYDYWDTAEEVDLPESILIVELIKPKVCYAESEIQQSRYYDITGFINYDPKISSSSSNTSVHLNFEVPTNNDVSASIASTLYTIEKSATNTQHSISIFFDVVSLEADHRFRPSIGNPSGTNHTTNSGIDPTNQGFQRDR